MSFDRTLKKEDESKFGAGICTEKWMGGLVSLEARGESWPNSKIVKTFDALITHIVDWTFVIHTPWFSGEKREQAFNIVGRQKSVEDNKVERLQANSSS